MGQGDVLELLKKENCWMTAKEMSEKLGIGRGTISHNLSKMGNCVHRKEVAMNNKYRKTQYLYKAKWLRNSPPIKEK